MWIAMRILMHGLTVIGTGEFVELSDFLNVFDGTISATANLLKTGPPHLQMLSKQDRCSRAAGGLPRKCRSEVREAFCTNYFTNSCFITRVAAQFLPKLLIAIAMFGPGLLRAVL